MLPKSRKASHIILIEDIEIILKEKKKEINGQKLGYLNRNFHLDLYKKIDRIVCQLKFSEAATGGVL